MQGAGSWATAKRWPLTTTPDERALACGLAETVTVSDASPCPDAGATCSHDASADALQLHSRAATTGTVRRPPVAVTELLAVPNDVWQRASEGAVTSETLVAPQPIVAAASKSAAKEPLRRAITARIDA